MGTSKGKLQERPAQPAEIATNLAVGKAALQSSFSLFSHADDPLRALSGAPNGAFSFHTAHDIDPWWLLDLGRICRIDKLVVYNRGDGAQHRIRHFRIDVFDPAVGGWTSIYAAENEFGGILDDNPLRLHFGAKPKVARFIKLAIEGENYLHLDKVEVYGTSPQEAYEEALRRAEPPPLPTTTMAEPRVDDARGLGAVVGLIRGYADIADYEPLIARNAAIFETINKGRSTHYPLLIWHEGNISPEHQAHILACEQNRDVRFIDISDRWKLPLGLTGADMEEHWPVGYRLMCKFNTIDIWDLTRSFDYILRVDEDCRLTRIAADPFQWMHDSDLDCGFSWLIDDLHELTNETLPPFVEAYLIVNGIRSQSAWPLTSCFPYTNVMMGRGDFFRSPKVWRFLNQAITERDFTLNAGAIMWFSASRSTCIHRWRKSSRSKSLRTRMTATTRRLSRMTKREPAHCARVVSRPGLAFRNCPLRSARPSYFKASKLGRPTRILDRISSIRWKKVDMAWSHVGLPTRVG